MFIRIKKIKGLEYAYLVKSVWKDKTARQKVVQYLGKVYVLNKTNTAAFETFCKEENKNIENADLKAIIQALMEWTLSQYGFTKAGFSQYVFNNENLIAIRGMGKSRGNWEIDPEKIKKNQSPVDDPLLQKKWLLYDGKLVGDPEKLKIISGKKEVTLKINDGYMNSFTLKELLNIQLSKKTEEQRQAATQLANAFVNAGIQVPKDIFIEVFQKVYQ